MDKKPIDASSFWFDPADLGELITVYGDEASKGDGLDFGIERLDRRIIPARAAQMNFIVARPGGGKTTFMAIRARRAMKKILERKTQDKECVVIISLDQCVEEVYAMLTSSPMLSPTGLAWGKIPHQQLIEHSRKNIHLPLRIIGKSAIKRSNTTMTFDEIFAAIDDIYKKQGVRPVHIGFDYIQIARTNPGSQKDIFQQVRDAVLRCEDLSYAYGASFDCCVQAGRGVDKYADKIPTLSDCQYSSSIEQAGYRVFGLWRPHVTEQTPTIKIPTKEGVKEYPVTSDLFIMRLNKHKMTEAGYTFVLKLDPLSVQLFDWEADR